MRRDWALEMSARRVASAWVCAQIRLVPGLEDAYLKDGSVPTKLDKKGYLVTDQVPSVPDVQVPTKLIQSSGNTAFSLLTKFSPREDQVSRRVAARYLASRHVEAGLRDWLVWIARPFKVILKHHKEFINGPVDDAVDAIIKDLAPKLVKTLQEREVDEVVDQFQEGASQGWADATEGHSATINRVLKEVQVGYAWGFSHSGEWDGKMLPNGIRRQIVLGAAIQFSKRITEEVALNLLRKVWHAVNPVNTVKAILVAVKKHGWKLGVGFALFEVFEHLLLPTLLVALTGNKNLLALTSLPIGEVIYAIVFRVLGRTPQELNQADEEGHLDWYEQEYGPVRLATKTPAQKEDKDVRQMLKPDPKKKPAREDLRRNRMRTDDEDLAGEGDDLSLNFKKIAVALLAERWVRQLLAIDGSTSPEPPKPPEHKPGEVWKTEDGKWSANNKDGVTHTFGDNSAAKAQAEAYAEGKDVPKEEEGGKVKEKTPAQAEAVRKQRLKTQVKIQRDKLDKHLVDLVGKLPKKTADKLQALLGQADPSPDLEAAEKKAGEAQTEMDRVDAELDHEKADELRQKVYDAKLEGDTKTAKTAQTELDELEKPLKAAQFKQSLARKEADRLKRAETKAGGDTKAKFVAAVAAALEEVERTAVEDLAANGVTQAAMEAASQDPFKKVDWDDTASVARALVQQNLNDKILLNPAFVGGHNLSEKSLDDKGLTDRAEASFNQYRHGKVAARKKAAENVVQQLAELDPDSPQAKELNRIIDGLHLAMEMNGEKWDITGPDGKLLRDPLDPKMGLLARQMVAQGDARVLLSDGKDMHKARESVRDAMGRLGDGELQEMAKDTPWSPLGDLLGGLGGLTLDPKVAELLRGLIRDLGVNNMTLNQGLVKAVEGKKIPASNPVEAFEETREKFKPKNLVEAIKSLADCIAETQEKGGDASECFETVEEIKRMQVKEAAEALDKASREAGVEPDPQNPYVAVVRAVAESGDLSFLDQPLKPERTIEQEKQDFIRHMKNPGDRKRIQEMSPEDFEAMLASIFSDDENLGEGKPSP